MSEPAVTKIQSRRRVIVVILLALAVVGAAMRQVTDRTSLSHDIGTLLMVMWVPAVGNIMGWFLQKWGPKSRRVADFAPGAAFVAHRQVALRFDGLRPLAGDEVACTLLLGTEGFTARLRSAPQASGVAGHLDDVFDLEFLAPALALPRFQPGTAFRLLFAGTVAGEGRVLAVLETATSR